MLPSDEPQYTLGRGSRIISVMLQPERVEFLSAALANSTGEAPETHSVQKRVEN